MLTLTVLGSRTPYPRPDQPCSGYLIQATDATLWVDAGSGTLAELQRHVPLDDLTALWISHLHPDHCGDLPAVANWLLNTDQSRRLPVWGPPGWYERLSAFTGADLNPVLDPRELHDGQTVRVDALQVHVREVAHSVATYGLRISLAGKVIAYSADSGSCQALTDLAADADLFLCEAGATDQATDQPAYHLTPEQAGTTAKQAGAHRLVLTHLAPDLPPATACLRAQTTFGQPVELAGSGDRYTLDT